MRYVVKRQTQDPLDMSLTTQIPLAFISSQSHLVVRQTFYLERISKIQINHGQCSVVGRATRES